MRPGRATTTDTARLEECLELAARARGATSPNPMVGSLVVRDGAVVGRGYHRSPGTEHAERLALAEAGEAARGATLYSNVEPCCHHGRTPPCVDSIVEAGIARVVACMGDPDPRVDGRGFERLRQAGVEVDVGQLEERAAELNEAYLCFKVRGTPLVLGKAALSLDGRMATRERDSQWITGEEARRRAHRLRAGSDAVLVGVGTVLADDPRLTARGVDGAGPRFRVVLDSRLRTPPGARLFREERGRVLLLATGQAREGARAELEGAGAEVVELDADGEGRVAWHAVLEALARRDVMQLMVEGGSAVLTSAFEADIIDKLHLFYAPVLIGGAASLPLWGGEGVSDLGAAPRLHRVREHRLGDDWAVEGYLHPPRPISR